jgi:hypothetical protein
MTTRSRLPAAAAALLLMAISATCGGLVAAQDPFIIPLAPALLPWPANNLTQAYQAGSPVAELNLAKVSLGPCTYRMMHYHIAADEVLVVVAGRLESVLLAPNNTVYPRSLDTGDNVVYPKGAGKRHCTRWRTEPFIRNTVCMEGGTGGSSCCFLAAIAEAHYT